MAPTTTEGFILRKINFRETSVILTIFSKEFGKIKGVLKGVRKEKSKISPLCFAEGAHIEIKVYKKRTELYLLSSPYLINFFQFENRKSISLYFWILKLVDLFLIENQKEEKIFYLIEKSGRNLQKTKKPWLIFLSFKIKFIEILGYGVKVDKCCRCNKNKKNFLFSPKDGGIICKECSKNEANCVKISNKMISIIRFIKKVDFKNLEVLNITRKEGEKINFFSNLILYYHTDLNFIWWQNEKDIFRTDYRGNK